MEYFTLFGITPAFTVDLSQLKRQYYRLSSDVHPDRHTQATQGEQAGALDRSAMVNQAYKTLKDDHARMRYILSEAGLLDDESKLAIPQDFLMEMMDINEALMDLQMGDDADVDSISQQIGEMERDLSSTAEPAMATYDASQDVTVLPIVLDYYLKRKYLRRIEEQLAGL